MAHSRLSKVSLCAALVLGLCTPASAAWFRAETAHFVVYSDDREAAVRQMASELETFDGVLRRFHTTGEQDGAASNKLTVFVLDDMAAIQRLCGCQNVGGFYLGRAAGSVAFTPRRDNAESAIDMKSRTVLQHEYAHHFLFANYASAYPAWFSEGYAEFAGTFRRDKDGLTIGSPALHRAYGLLVGGARLSATAMFDPVGRKLSPEQRELLYGRGWLLTHYIMFDSGRRAQLAKYLAAINDGKPSLAAATEAFGDLKALDRNLDKYLTARTMKSMLMSPSSVPVPTVTLRALAAGEAAMIDQRIVSVRGVNEKTARTVFAKAQPIAAKYPDDAVTQGWFAEMAFDAGNLDAADAAADRAIARDPKSSQALLYKGMIGVRRAAKGKDGKVGDDAAWRTARSYIVRANKLDPENAQPLLTFYDSFLAEGRPPTKNAVAGLIRAQELAPQDDGLRFMAMAQSVRDGELDRAKTLLKPLAFDPHGGADNPAAKLLAALDATKDKAAAVVALEESMKSDGAQAQDKPGDPKAGNKDDAGPKAPR